MSNKFYFHEGFVKAIRTLPEEDQLRAYNIVVDYALTGEVPDDLGNFEGIFYVIQTVIDAENKSRNDGKKGGRPPKETTEKTPKKPQKNPGLKQVSERERENEKKESDKEKKDKEIESINNPPIVPPRGMESEFESLWEIYPKKQGKAQALKSYIKARKEGTTVGEVRAGIEAYNSYLVRERIERKFIKMGSTYFNQRAWTDEYSTSRPGEREDQRSDYNTLVF